MKYELQINGSEYPYFETQDLADALGILPVWVAQYNKAGKTDLVQHMTDSYGFGELFRWKGEVLADGTYKSQYEQEDDMPFIGRMKTNDGMVYFYPYGIVALPTNDGYFVTRMD